VYWATTNDAGRRRAAHACPRSSPPRRRGACSASDPSTRCGVGVSSRTEAGTPPDTTSTSPTRSAFAAAAARAWGLPGERHEVRALDASVVEDGREQFRGIGLVVLRDRRRLPVAGPVEGEHAHARVCAGSSYSPASSRDPGVPWKNTTGSPSGSPNSVYATGVPS